MAPNSYSFVSYFVRAVFLSALFALTSFSAISSAAVPPGSATPTKKIYILIYDASAADAAKRISPELSKQFFGLPVSIVSMKKPLPASLIDPKRGQADAEALIKEVGKSAPPNALRVLAIVPMDLYVGRLPYVFGVGDPKSGVGVFSTFRIRTGEKKRFRERLLTGVVHEVGHMFGLVHCQYPLTCVMGPSRSLSDFDAKPWAFCPTCRAKLRKAVDAAIAPPTADNESPKSQ